MATYIDERDAAIAAIQALIAPNGVGAITGQVHQDNEVNQTNDAYLNLVGYDNYGFVIVRTGIDPATGIETNDAVQNGLNLKAAYANACALTPNGQPLSNTNRAAVLIMPGSYDFRNSPLEMDTEFVDIIGIGSPEDIFVTSQYSVNDGKGTITKICDNAVIKNITISNGATAAGLFTDLDASGFAPQAVYSNESIDNVIFFSSATGSPYMRIGVQYAGSYTNCKVVRQGFTPWVMFAGAIGTFKNCDAGSDYGFGFSFGSPTLGNLNTSGTFENCSCFVGFGWYSVGETGTVSGTFKNCTAQSGSFGNAGGFVTGTFIGCRGGNDCFGINNASSTLSNYGQYIDCVGGDNSFSGFEVGGKFVNCKAGLNSFNSLSNITISAEFHNCISGQSSFAATSINAGSYYGCTSGINSFGISTISGGSILGNYINCTAGNNSFGFSTSVLTQTTNSGSYTGCKAGSNSFGGDTIDGIFENCIASDQSFGYSPSSSSPIAFSAAKFYYCKGGDFCFGVSALMDVDTEFHFCEGGNNCFGVNNGGAGQYIRSKFYNCTAGNSSFAVGVQGPRGTGPGDPITAEFHNCVGGNTCFGAGGGIEMAGLCVNCTAGNWSFGTSQSNGLNQWAEASGQFHNCVGGDNCFGASSGTNGGAVASGQFYNCQAGTESFGSNNGAAGITTCYASGYFVDCCGGSFSFAGHANAYKTGKFIRCVLQGDSATGIAANDEGPLVENGLMEDCTWVVGGALEAALLVGNLNSPIAPGDEAPKIYGGKYIAGAGATRSILSENIATATPSASILQIRSNVIIDGSINNLAISGALDTEGNYTYSGL